MCLVLLIGLSLTRLCHKEYTKENMKKFFIIFLTIILMLCSFSSIVAYEQIDCVGNIKEQLDNIEMNINKNNIDEAKLCLMKLRQYVYFFATELTKQNAYTSRVLDIINFSALAIKDCNTEYIIKARMVLDEIVLGKQNFVSENNHS